MTTPRRQHFLDIDSSECTSESAYHSRRAFLKASGLLGIGTLGAMGMAGEVYAWASDDEVDKALRASVRSVPGSAFKIGPRNAKYTVKRPITEELTAARFNNFYEFGTDKERCWLEAQKLTVRPWTVEVGGLVKKPQTLAIDDIIRKMPCEERLYRFRCVERWAMVVPWAGFPFKAFLDWVEPLSLAKFVRFISFHRPSEAVGQQPGSIWNNWPYYEGLTMEEASNELAFVATGLYGHDLPGQHGAPFRMVLPWKYGYKGPKSVVKIEFTDKKPRTFWWDYAANEYGFYSNVNPNKPHPRWSQEYETMIGTGEQHATLIYNGYGEYVAHMYNGNEH